VYTVKFLHEAEIEIADACEWYEKQQKGLGKRFINEVDQYITLIAKKPLHYNVRFVGRFRFAVLQIFPYMIAYKVDDVNKVIRVHSVFHTSRNPDQFNS
jgi:hypothetical protein